MSAVDVLEFSDNEVVPIKELVDLYESVGWMRYVADPDALARAVDRSDYVVTARDAEGLLVGLARVLSDDVSIMYLQDVLVRPSHHRRGIGAILVQRCLTKYEHVHQNMLITDDEPGQLAFYNSLGYHNLNDLGEIKINAFIQMRGLD